MPKNNLHFCVFILCFLFLTSCNTAQSGYPIFLGHGGTISKTYSLIEIKPRTFKSFEMISIGLNLEGRSVCTSKKAEERICTQELKDRYPNYVAPKDLIFDPSKNYTDKEITDQKIKFEEWYAKNVKERVDAWYGEVEKQPLSDFQVVVVDTNNNEIPFVYVGSGGGYCNRENDNVCKQFTLDVKNSHIDSLEGITIKGLKLRSLEVELKISNVYAVRVYSRD
jgi:hypothetical protein